MNPPHNGPPINKTRRNKIPDRHLALIVGLCLILLIIGLSVFISCPSSSQYNILRIVISIAVAGVAAVLPGMFQLRLHPIITAGGALAVFGFVYRFDPAQLSTPDSCGEIELTVYVHGVKGKQDIVLQNTGRLVVDFGSDRRSTLIGENGRTYFGEIPSKFRNQEVTVGLEATGFEQADPKKQYKLDGKPIYLAVKKAQQLGIVSGSVKNWNGSKRIEGALVMVDNDTITSTNKRGIFKMSLPEEMKKDKYVLTVQKEGYKTRIEDYYPLSGDIEIRLEE